MFRKIGLLTAVALMAFAVPAMGAAKVNKDGSLAGADRGQRVQISCAHLRFTNLSANNTNQATASLVPVDLAGSDINFSSIGRGCVVANFEAQAFAQGTGNVLLVSAVLDGAGSVNGEVQLQSDSLSLSNAHGYNFLFVNVPGGNHDFKIQFRSGTGSVVNINKFSTVLTHR